MLTRVAALVVGGMLGFVATAVGAADSSRIAVELRSSEAAASAVVEEVELYARSHALVIGIDDYRDGWPRLSMAVKDAGAVAEALRANGFEVTLKVNLNARELRDTLEEFYLARGEAPDARLFVWFAGHGHSENGEGFLIPADAPKPTAGSQFYRTALSLRRIGEYVRLARAKHAFAVFDSCFSGTIFDAARALPPTAITRATTLPARQFMTSGDAGQTVSDNGSFRELFLRALRGEEPADANRDGYLTASELGLFLTDRVTNLTRSKQTPRYGKLRDQDWDRGDFVFTVPARMPKVAAAAPPPEPAPAAVRGMAEAARIQQESLFWESIKDSGDAAAYRAYLEAYPTGAFAPLARVKLNAAAATARGLAAEADQAAARRKQSDEAARERERQLAKLRAEMAAERKRIEAERAALAAQQQRQQLALATPPAQRLPVTLEAAEYLPLPKGTEVEYDDGWQFQVTAVDNFKVETRSSYQQYRFIYAGVVLFGEDINLSKVTCNLTGGSGCENAQPGISLAQGQNTLAKLWPLKVGKTAEFILDHDPPQNPYMNLVDERWSVKLTVDRVERVAVLGSSLETFVLRSTATTETGRRFDQTQWYHPASGLIVKSERAWSGKATEYSLSSGMPGGRESFTLKSVRFPEGARNSLTQTASVAAPRLALASSPSQVLPVTAEAMDYRPLPKGTYVEYDDGWRFRVTSVDGMKTETLSEAQQYRHIYAGAAIFGDDLDLTRFVCLVHCEKTQPAIDLVAGKASLQALWPLKVGNTAEFKLEHEASRNDYVQSVEDVWTVKVTVDRQEEIRIGDRTLATFVFKSQAQTTTGRQFDQTHWYHPGSGLIVRLERTWSGKATAHSVPAGMPGRTQRFELRRASFPDGAKNALN